MRAAAPALPTNVDVATDDAPYGIGAGQTLRLQNEGVLRDNFTAGPGSSLVAIGGKIGGNFEVDRGSVAIAGGTVGDGMDILTGARAIVSGGQVGSLWQVALGGELKVTGGSLNSSGDVGGVVSIEGGVVESINATNQAVVTLAAGKLRRATVRSGATLRIDGGELVNSADIESGGVFHVTGGQMGGLNARAGAHGDIHGGNIRDFIASSTASVDVRGGTFGDQLSFDAGANVTINGSDFEIDGSTVSGLAAPGASASITVLDGQLFSGVLEDGTPFAFSSQMGDRPRTVQLRLAPHTSGPTVVMVPAADAPLGVHGGQSLILGEGGRLQSNFTAGRGSLVRVEGGVVGDNFEAVGAAATIAGGVLEGKVDALLDSTVTVVGGRINGSLSAFSGSRVSMQAGRANRIAALAASDVTISGGKVDFLNVSQNSLTTWTGGVVDDLSTSGLNSLEIHGFGFAVNGVPVANLTTPGDRAPLNVPSNGGLLTGTLADGTPLAIQRLSSSMFATGSTTLVLSEQAPPRTPTMQTVSDQQGPFAIGLGQTLELIAGGRLTDDFVAGQGSTLIVNGGTTDDGLKAAGAKVIVTRGEVGALTLFRNSQLSVLGGLTSNSELIAEAGSVIDVYGRNFRLNGAPLTGLQLPGAFRVISNRNYDRLTADLPSGESLQWILNPIVGPTREGARNGISSSAILRVWVVPEPSPLLLAFLPCAAFGAIRRGSRFAHG